MQYSILSNNCWHQRVAKKYGIFPYTSPLVDIMVYNSEYLKLLSNINNIDWSNIERNGLWSSHWCKYIMQGDPENRSSTSWLKDYNNEYVAEICPIHDRFIREFRPKAFRRSERLIGSKIIAKWSELPECTPEMTIQFIEGYPDMMKIVYLHNDWDNNQLALKYAKWKYSIRMHDIFEADNITFILVADKPALGRKFTAPDLHNLEVDMTWINSDNIDYDMDILEYTQFHKIFKEMGHDYKQLTCSDLIKRFAESPNLNLDNV